MVGLGAVELAREVEEGAVGHVVRQPHPDRVGRQVAAREPRGWRVLVAVLLVVVEGIFDARHDQTLRPPPANRLQTRWERACTARNIGFTALPTKKGCPPGHT